METYTKNFSLTKGKPLNNGACNANLDTIDAVLAEALAYPYVPITTGKAESGNLETENVGIKTLQVGNHLLLRDQGNGCFIIELDIPALAAALRKAR